MTDREELGRLADRMEQHVISRLPGSEPVVKNGAWQMMLDAASALRRLAEAGTQEADFPADGSCVRCGAVPRTASGLCNTCLDEDAERYENAPPAPSVAVKVKALEWHEGAPSKPWCDEWFIAETAFHDRVVLKALPEEYTYDFKTADETYIKADNIKRWMQFPDSEFTAPPASALITAPQDDVREAYIAGATAVHNEWVSASEGGDGPPRGEPDFNEAASDYAALRGNQSDGGRVCTCHHDDNPPTPCPQKFAHSECVAASDTTPSSRPEVSVEELAEALCKACGKYWWQADIHSTKNARWINAARALKAKYHMEGRE